MLLPFCLDLFVQNILFYIKEADLSIFLEFQELPMYTYTLLKLTTSYKSCFTLFPDKWFSSRMFLHIQSTKGIRISDLVRGQQYSFLRCFAAFGKLWKFMHKSPILN